MTEQDRFYADMGALIRKARIAKDLTQAQLASYLALNRTSVTNIEKGKQKILVHTIVEISKCLHTPLDKLLPVLSRSPKFAKVKNLLPLGSSKEQHDFFASVIRQSRKGELRNANSTKTD